MFSERIKDEKKKCAECQEFKTFSDFAKDSECLGGLKNKCKVCNNLVAAEKRLSNGIKKKKIATVDEFGLKLCLCCFEKKPLLDFNTLKMGLGGYKPICKLCSNSISKEYYNSNQKEIIEKQRNRYFATPTNRSDRRIRRFEKDSGETVYRDGSVTDDFLFSLYSQETCYYCNNKVDNEDKVADHKTPLNRKGEHTKDNLTLSCINCNSSKGDLTELEYLVKRNGFVKNKHSPVSVRHILTDEIINFKNITSCSTFFNLESSVLLRHLQSNNQGRLSKNWYVFKFKDEFDWPILDEEEINENTLQYGRGLCIAKKIEFGLDNLLDIPIGTVVIDVSRNKVCEHLKFSNKCVEQHMRIKEPNTAYRGWIFIIGNKPTKQLIKELNEK